MIVRTERVIDMAALKKANENTLFDDGLPGTDVELLETIARFDDWGLFPEIVSDTKVELIP